MSRAEFNPDPCTGCSGSLGRRDFLRDTAAAVATLFITFGADPLRASTLPIRMATGSSLGRDELSYPLPDNDGVTIDKPNEIILVRWQRFVYAFALSCPHQRTMLRWREREKRFQCPKHKSKYQPDGAFISGRATRGMDRYPVRLHGSTVTVNKASSIQEDEDAQAWGSAVARIL